MEHHLGIGFESSYDTAIAPSLWLEVLSEAIRMEPNVVAVDTIRANGTRIHKTVGKVTRGPFRAICNYQDLPSLFYAIFGSVTTTGAGPYDHTVPQYPVGAIDTEDLTFEVQRDEGGDGETTKYSGCVLTELKMSMGLDQPILVEGQVLGSGTEVTGSANTPSYRDFDISLPTEMTFTVDSVSRDIEALELTLTWPHDEPRALGSSVFARKPKPSGPMTVTGSFTLLNHSASIYTLYRASTVCDLQITANDGTHDFIVNLNKTTLTQGTPALDGPGVPKPTVEFTVAEDTSLESPIQVACTNDQATLP